MYEGGKQPAFRGWNQKTLYLTSFFGEGYKEELRAVIAGKSLRIRQKGLLQRSRAEAVSSSFIDIQSKMAEGKTKATRMAKKYNRKKQPERMSFEEKE